MQLPEVETDSWDITPEGQEVENSLVDYKPGQWLSRYRAFKLGAPRCSAQTAINWAKERVEEPDVLHAVAGLHRFGVQTVSSCAGHVYHGSPWPSIGIDSQSCQALLHVWQSYPLPGWGLLPMDWVDNQPMDSAKHYIILPDTLLKGVDLNNPLRISGLIQDLPLLTNALPGIPAHVRMQNRSDKDIPLDRYQARREQLVSQLPFYQAQIRHWGFELLEA